MKLCTVSPLGQSRKFLGVALIDGSILDLNSAHESLFGEPSPLFATMIDWIEGGTSAFNLAQSIRDQVETNRIEGLLFCRIL